MPQRAASDQAVAPESVPSAALEQQLLVLLVLQLQLLLLLVLLLLLLELLLVLLLVLQQGLRPKQQQCAWHPGQRQIRLWPCGHAGTRRKGQPYCQVHCHN